MRWLHLLLEIVRRNQQKREYARNEQRDRRQQRQLRNDVKRRSAATYSAPQHVQDTGQKQVKVFLNAKRPGVAPQSSIIVLYKQGFGYQSIRRYFHPRHQHQYDCADHVGVESRVDLESPSYQETLRTE